MRSARSSGVIAAGLTAVWLALSSCGGSAGASSGPVSVVASTNVYGDIARQIAGDTVTITSIISDPSQDPHSYEADATTQLELSKADLVVENGGGYDDFVGSMLKTAGNTSVPVINAVTLSGKVAPAGGELNEHVWYDFPTVEKVAKAIAAALSRAAPANAALYERNAATFTQAVTGLEAQEQSIKTAHAGTGVAITEPVPLYLLDACGLVNRTPPAFSEAIEEGTDVSVAVLNQTLQQFRSGAVKVLAYNEQTSGPQTERVLAEAKSDGVAVLPVTETLPAGQDYLGWMSANLRSLSAALAR